MSNIFILCAGRTASTTFTKACSYITNYTCAHESRVQHYNSSRVNYPANHIEIDNRLAWFTTQLEKKYKDNGYYLHLTRDPKAIAKSYLERWHLKESIVKAYGHGILMKPTIKKSERYQICLDYVEHVDETIKMFLSTKSNVKVIDIKNLQERFPEFFQWIGAEGDIDKCINEFDVYSNQNNTHILRKLTKYLSR